MFNTLPTGFLHYEVLKPLGSGGFGVVYLARDTYLKRLVVLKMLHDHIANDPKMVKRFLQEAQAMARLDHVNIVRVNRVENNPQRPFFEMEYVEGTTLSGYRGKRVLSLPEAIPILKQIAHALDVAHQQKIIHRDVKPANILVKSDGILKLTDFGIAKLLEITGTGLHSTGGIVGTPNYMSPEQATFSRKDEIGPASDIYALGVVAYEMLTGTLPFKGANFYAILQAHAKEPPPNPRTFNRYLLPATADAVLKALAKEPINRYPTASAFIEALEQADWVSPTTNTRASAPIASTLGHYSTTPVSSTSPHTASPSSHHVATSTPSVAQNTISVSSNHTLLRMMIGVLIGLFVAVIFVGLFINLLSNEPKEVENAPVSTASVPSEESGVTVVPEDAVTIPPMTPFPTNVPVTVAPTTISSPTDAQPESCPVISPALVSESVNYDEGKAVFHPLSSDHYVVSAASNIYVFDTFSEIRQNLIDGSSHNRDIAFSINGTFLAVVPFGQIEFYTANIVDNQLVINTMRDPLPIPDTWFSSISFSPDEELFVFSGNLSGEPSRLEAWRTKNWTFLTSSKQPTSVGTTFSPLLTSSDVDYWFVSQDNDSSSLRVWAVKDSVFTYRPEKRVEMESISSAQAIEFSADATKLVVGTANGNIQLIDTSKSTWGEPQTIYTHNKAIQSLSVSSDSRYVASASQDGTAEVWDITTQTCQYRLEQHPENVSSIDFSPDGKTIVTVSGKKAYVWKVE